MSMVARFGYQNFTLTFHYVDALQFDIPLEEVNQVHPNRPAKLPAVQEPKPSLSKAVVSPSLKSSLATEDMPGTSA